MSQRRGPPKVSPLAHFDCSQHHLFILTDTSLVCTICSLWRTVKVDRLLKSLLYGFLLSRPQDHVGMFGLDKLCCC